MFNRYNELYEMYLRILKSKYDSEKPYYNLEECCISCDHFKWELSGMLALLENIGEITIDEKEIEFKRILSKFSTIELFNASMTKGECMVYTK